MIEEHPNPERRWRHRRRMAYMTLVSALLMPVITIWAPALGEVAMPFYLFAAGVVGVYTASATAETIKTQMGKP